MRFDCSVAKVKTNKQKNKKPRMFPASLSPKIETNKKPSAFVYGDVRMDGSTSQTESKAGEGCGSRKLLEVAWPW